MNHNKQPRRLLAMALSVVMVLGMLPASAAAENLPAGVSGEITAFKKLANATATQIVPLGTSFDKLDLPETLTATVRFAADTVPLAATSGAAIQVSDESQQEEEKPKPETKDPDAGYEETTVSVPVTWDASPDYNGDQAGDYTFTAEISGFTVGAELPTITVTVGQAAVKGTITAFDELKEDIRWQNTAEPVFPETLNGIVEGQTTQIPVTWEADHDYDSDSPTTGLYVFIAKPGDGYTIAAEMEAPLITVYIPASKRIMLRMAGEGTSVSPLEIFTAAQLAEIAVLVNAGRLETFLFNDSSTTVSLKLMNDLDLTAYGEGWNGGKGWEPIGTSTNPFKGIFDGNNNKITGLFINRSEELTGLFGYVDGGTVKNLELEEVSITGGDAAGGVAGYVNDANSSVTNCNVTGSVSGAGGVGGVAGYAYGSISNCSVTGSVSGAGGIGGAAGYAYGSISNCSVTGSISGAGGIGRIGGVVGSTNGNVTNCYAASTITGEGDKVGGVAGYVEPNGGVANCFTTGTITSNGTGNEVGGVAGYVAHNGGVTNCYAIGKIFATGIYIGGVAGLAYGNVTNCAALNPSVSGAGAVERVAGAFADGTLSNNAAFSGMTIKVNNVDQPISGGTANNMNGADITSADITTGSYWKTSINWNNPTVWTVENGKMPILAAILADVQDAAIPPHLAGGSNSCFLGEGTSAAPYQISTSEQLTKLAELVNDSATNAAYGGKDIYYKLTADLDLSAYGKNFNSGKGWVPIGKTITNSFQGTFDGDNKKITGLSIIGRTERYSGLFGYIGDGTVKNLVLEQVNITGGSNAGGVAGRIDGSVENCRVTGTVISTGSYVGGVAGFVYSGSVTNCCATGAVSGSVEVGGVAGSVGASSITNCYSSSIVTSEASWVGGVVGSVGNGSVTNCYATGTVSGSSSEAGGVAGYVANSSVTNCYVTGAVNGSSKVGGVAGSVSGINSKVTNCAALNPSVSGRGEVGRVAGFNDRGTLSGNAAFSDMTVKVNGVNQTIGNCEANTINGVDINAAAIKADGTIGSRFTDTSIWTAENGKLPVLKGIAAGTQDTVLPPHLAGGSNSYFLGEGTSAAPYQIGTAEQLAKLAELVNDPVTNAAYGGKNIYYQLTDTIDLSAYGKSWNSKKGWTPIGSDANPFKGTFDGNKQKITGLFIDSLVSMIGLFGYVEGGTIQNLGLEKVNVTGINSVSGVVGYIGGGSVTNCYVTGSVNSKGSADVGGIAGSVSFSSEITSCYVTGSVTGTNSVGGVAGSVFNSNSSVTNCYATGTVRGIGSYIGGVVGDVSSGSVTNCYTTGTISSEAGSKVGGVAGYVLDSATVKNCAALNPSVSGSSEVGRVTGFAGNGVILSGNVAFSGMMGGGISTGTDNPDGANITSGQMNTASFWKDNGNWDTSGWDAGIWTIQDGKLPVLKDVGGMQSGDGGLYLTERDIAGATVTLNKDIYTYTGSPITPSLTVTFGGETLKKDVDYQVSVVGGSASNGINVGTVTLNLTGTGNFTGTKTGVTFNIEKASQSAPAAPTLSSKTETSVILTLIFGMEYRLGIDGVWQEPSGFTALDPNTAYSFYARLKGDANYNPSPASAALSVTTDKSMLGGTVSIIGTEKYGNTLSVDTSGLGAIYGGNLGTLSYQWNRNGVPISVPTTSDYTLVQADIDAQITVTVTAENCTGSVTSNPTAAVEKANGPAAPASVTGSYTGDGSTFIYTVNEIPGAEYSKDGVSWQDSNVFTSFTTSSPETTFYARIKETDTQKAGTPGNTGTVRFMVLENTQVPPLTYTVSGGSNSRSITITKVSGAEYKFGDDAWDSTRSKGGYSGTQTVAVQIRYAQTATHKPSRVNSANVNVAKQNQSAPPAFELGYTYNANIDQFTVTIPEQANAEYSFDGSNYNQTRTKTAAPGDSVTGYIRYQETEDKNQSPAVTDTLTLPILVTSIAVSGTGDQSSITIKGGTLQMLAAVLPAGATQAVTWSVSGSGAAVSPTGLLTASANGTVTVRATAKDGTGVYGEKTITISGQITSGDSGNGGNGNGGGWSSSGSSVSGGGTATLEKQPDQPVTAAAPVTATAGTNGTANAMIPDKVITDAIAKAQADAKEQNKTSNGIGVAVTLNNPANTTALGIVLTQLTLRQLTDANLQRFEVKGQVLTLNLSQTALQQIQKQSTGDVTITIKPVTIKGVRNAYNITISFVKDGKIMNIKNFGSGGSITLYIPCTPGKNEAAGYLYAVYVDASGNVSRIPGSAYDANSGNMIFTTDHLSVYGVRYKAPSAKFTDISGHWAKESIDYVVGRGLFGGNAEGKFAPDTAITRGDFVTALGRMTGVDTKAYNKSSFTDVKAGSYYLPYIEWAYSKDILQGVGNCQYAPERAITRQEIAVILANYAKATGYKLPVTRTVITFTDDSSISSDYKEAVKAMQQAGIVMGAQKNHFNPAGNTTRAEVCAILQRYIKLTIDPATAQGWALNDSGQYLYYKDGKALIGTQTIDGVKYFFETTGALKTGWVKDEAGNWRFYSGKTMLAGFWDLGANGNNKRYYFTKEGIMIAGKWLEIDGKWFYFNADGSLARSTKIDGCEVDENGVRKTK